MHDLSLDASPAFSDLQTLNGAHLAIAARDDLMIVGLAAFRGKTDVLKAILNARYGVSLPDRPCAVTSKDLTILWAGSAQWLAIAERRDGRDLETELKEVAQGLAAVVDHSDGRAVVVVSGSDARKVFGKGFSIDLHARAFALNDVAITQASHISATIWMTSEAPSYTILVPRSYADSFAEWLTSSAAEFLSA